MSLRSDGRYRCDRCGRELENGGVQECAPITTLREDGTPITYHFGREEGCESKVLSKRNLAAYQDTEGPP